jgi:hypothetical protein
MTIELNSKEEMISLLGKKTNLSVVAPENTSAMVVFLYEEDKNRKNRKSNLVNQIMPKLGFAVISAEYSMNDKSRRIGLKLNEIIAWISKSVFQELTISLFIVGDGFSDLIESLNENNTTVNGLITMSQSVPIKRKDLNCKIPVLIVSAEEDKEFNEAAHLMLNNEKVSNFEMKVISNASRYYSELGKLGEAINVGGKWLLKNRLEIPVRSNKVTDSVQ